MERLYFDPPSIVQHGIAYTTLSCTKTIENLYHVKPLTPKHFHVKPIINMEMECLQTTSIWKLDNDET